MKLPDTHAHLDGFIKNGALGETLERAKRAGVERIITCSATPADWISYRDAAEKHPEIFWQAGIHPEDISDDSDTALDALPSLFVGGGRLPVAVGEIGLDFHFLPDDPEESERKKLRQREIFARQLRIPAAQSTSALPKSSARGSTSQTRFSTVLRVRPKSSPSLTSAAQGRRSRG